MLRATHAPQGLSRPRYNSSASESEGLHDYEERVNDDEGKATYSLALAKEAEC